MIALIATVINAVSDSSDIKTAGADEAPIALEDVKTETTLSDVVDIHRLSNEFNAHWTARFNLSQSSEDGLYETINISHRSSHMELTVVPADYLKPTGKTELYLDDSSFTNSRKHVNTFDTLDDAIEEVKSRAYQ
ncbi:MULTISPECIES: hypothetical protein [unclassified Haloarcula]|jgi:hypothetical protein|uniref:hypothetical protein n=1 Tax=Haloarcula sp. K1 TaxID=1622207 RepID=UPI0007BC64EF|nr:hypothetical protein [Haloarcula sp. K1]KZX46218.1 hypothetical protein AV929_15710 [Haloarcula sp. K1]